MRFVGYFGTKDAAEHYCLQTAIERARHGMRPLADFWNNTAALVRQMDEKLVAYSVSKYHTETYRGED